MIAFRYWAKKAGRCAMALGSSAGVSLRARPLDREPCVRVLTYHRFADVPRDPFCLPPADFEVHVRALAAGNCAVTIDQVRRFVAGEIDLPDGACLVAIDDGLMSTLTEALPILRRWGVPAAAFVSAGLVDSGASDPEPYMGWPELRELLRSGLFTVGSHGYSHRALGRLPSAEVEREAKRSRDLLEDRLGVEVTSFAYPFGTKGDFNARTERALRDAGYTIAFNSMHGSVRRYADPISLPRVKVAAGDPTWMFGLLRRGAMDSWRAVDHLLWRLQRERTEVGVHEPGEVSLPAPPAIAPDLSKLDEPPRLQPAGADPLRQAAASR